MMRRRDFLAALAAFWAAPSTHARAWLHHGGGGGGPPSGWSALKIGGGGFARNLNRNTGDGTLFLQADSAGAWLYDTGTSLWKQVVTAASMASSSIFADTATPLPDSGIYAIASAPSDSSTVYMAYANTIYRSADKGGTWAKTAFSSLTGVQIVALFTSNTNYDTASPRLAIDPANKNIVLVGTPAGGIFKSTDGGATWAVVAGVPANAGNSSFAINADTTSGKVLNFAGGSVSGLKNNTTVAGHPNIPLNARISSWTSSSVTLTVNVTGTVPSGTTISFDHPSHTILFDPSSAVSGGATQGIYATSWGNGFYHSTDGGATWSTIAASGTVDTTKIGKAKIDSAGTYYCLSPTTWPGISQANQYFHKYNGSWTQLYNESTNKDLGTFCVDPANLSRIVIFRNGGGANISQDGGSTFLGYWSTASRSGAIGWQGFAAGGLFQTIGDAEFDLTAANKIVLSTGNGSLTCPVPVSGGWPSGLLAYAENSMGQESLVANKLITLPGSRGHVVRCDDFPIFVCDGTNYPSTFWGGPAAFNNGFGVHVSDIDYAGADLSGTIISQNGSRSIVSTDWGANWSAMANIPATQSGGCAASTATNWVYGRYSFGAWYTLNAGASWTALSGLPNFAGAVAPDWTKYTRLTLAADRVNAGEFSIYFYGQGVLRTTDGGATWSVLSNGSIPINSDEDSVYGIWSVPGQAGDLFGCWSPFSQAITLGSNLSTANKNSRLRYWNDVAGAWVSVANTVRPLAFAAGAAALGHTYPALYLLQYDASSPPKFGLYRCINFDAGPASATWTLLGLADNSFGPLNLVNRGWLAADPTNYGQVAYSTQGAGCAKGYFP